MDTGFAEEGIKTTVYAMHPRYTQRLSNTLHGVKKKKIQNHPVILSKPISSRALRRQDCVYRRTSQLLDFL